MTTQNNQNKLNFFTIQSLTHAIGIIEDAHPIPEYITYEQAYIQAFQYLIDTGHAWMLQGWYGRTAKHLIETGICKQAQEVLTRFQPTPRAN
mgnify:CR=1 FL=1